MLSNLDFGPGFTTQTWNLNSTWLSACNSLLEAVVSAHVKSCKWFEKQCNTVPGKSEPQIIGNRYIVVNCCDFVLCFCVVYCCCVVVISSSFLSLHIHLCSSLGMLLPLALHACPFLNLSCLTLDGISSQGLLLILIFLVKAAVLYVPATLAPTSLPTMPWSSALRDCNKLY